MTLMERLKSLSGGDDCLIRLALVEIESLRQQVALLREAASAEVRGALRGRKQLREALAATDPNQQQSRSFIGPVSDDDFLHMIDE